ncbi:MAG: class I SAM-dependent methyltransferase [Candidatus Peregrinibacteria bacterium]
MPTPDQVYIHCDELQNLPPICRKNWETELDLLTKKLNPNATVLQVGSMDATRIIALLQRRNDLIITGLEIEESLVNLSRSNLAKANLDATIIHGDITAPPSLPTFDHVLCLNNTLGYIPDEESAVIHMRKLGETVTISVYGEAFTDELAEAYFTSLGLNLDHIEGDTIHLKDFSVVRRYSRHTVEQWGGTITETPLGYYCEFPGNH